MVVPGARARGERALGACRDTRRPAIRSQRRWRERTRWPTAGASCYAAGQASHDRWESCPRVLLPNNAARAARGSGSPRRLFPLRPSPFPHRARRAGQRQRAPPTVALGARGLAAASGALETPPTPSANPGSPDARRGRSDADAPVPRASASRYSSGVRTGDRLGQDTIRFEEPPPPLHTHKLVQGCRGSLAQHGRLNSSRGRLSAEPGDASSEGTRST